jgi:predicted AAA+ superfamily ATPase
MIERKLWHTLRDELKSKEIIVITGPRQVGKTTTLKWLLEQVPGNKIYLDLTLVSIQNLFDSEDYQNIVTQLEAMGLDFSQRAHIAIDEIQYSKAIPRAIKYLYDHHDIKFLLTGSSAYYIKNHFTESLSGRKLLFELFPLSFPEYLRIQGVEFAPTLKDPSNPGHQIFDEFAFNTVHTHYENFILYGGFPAVALSQSAERKKAMLDEIYSSYINLDVEQLADFRSVSDLRRLIALLGARIGSRLNVDDLSRILDISRPTVTTYLAFLEQTYLIRLLPAYSGNVDVRERLPKKVYFVDTGIATINADLSGGAKFENTVRHQLSLIQKDGLAFYNKGTAEIDFILDKSIALEVKETPTERQLTTVGRRATALGITKAGLIGRYRSGRFNNYIWGGSL